MYPLRQNGPERPGRGSSSDLSVTALAKYQRLEALGLWRESETAQRREVVVSFGDASLVLSDINGTPLTHWSLAAVRTLRSSAKPTRYAPDTDSGEELELDDAEMIDAIAEVRARIRRAGPHPGRLRWGISAVLVAAVAALLWFWLPAISADYAARVLPKAQAEAIGEDLLDHASRLTGNPCADPQSTLALRRFERWLMPPGGRIHVVDLGARTSAHLPPAQVLINRLLLEEYPTPEVAAGFVLMERTRIETTDPMTALFRSLGAKGTLGFLAGGDLPTAALARFAGTQVTAMPPRPDEAQLVQRFHDAGLAIAPFAEALDATGKTTAGLLASGVVQGANNPGLSDADWITLQAICGDN